MKKISTKILIIALISGLLSILGNIIIAGCLRDIISSHQTIMDDYVTDREYMAKLMKLLYKDQHLLGRIAMDDDQLQESERSEEETRNELSDLIVEFSYRMKGGKDEQLFHIAYSSYCSYCVNVEKMISFRNEGSDEMTAYYYNSVLGSYVTVIDEKIGELDSYTEEQIDSAQDEINRQITTYKMLTVLLLLVIVILTAVCVALCTRISANLDNYKESLEKELGIKNQALRQHMEKMMLLQDGIIVGMANLIEGRDADTGKHVKRTSAYVQMISREAQKQGLYADILTDDYIDLMVKAAPLHDIGKISVPDRILLKPGRLTEEEYNEMKKHAPEGGRLIREIFTDIEDPEFIEMAYDISTFHHEKWDGSGYMANLSGDQIPLAARIMAIADVFDALISKRCYKNAYPIEKAFQIIEESSGIHFDPELVKIFLSIRSEVTEYLAEK